MKIHIILSLLLLASTAYGGATVNTQGNDNTFTGINTFTQPVVANITGHADTSGPWLNASDYGLTGVGDEHDKLQTAVTAASNGVLVLPGQYTSSAAIDLPTKITIVGLGRATSGITFTHTGDGFKSTHSVDGNTDANVEIRHLYLRNTNASNAGGGFVDVGGSFVDLFDVYLGGNGEANSGWKHDIILDQTEIATIDRCEIVQGAGSTSGIWIVNGPDHSLGASPNFTNRITITRNQFNSETAAQYQLLDDGGSNHTVADNNFNAGTYAMRFAGVNGLTVRNNEVEGHQLAILFSDTTLSGTRVGPVYGFTVEDNSFLDYHATRHIQIDALRNGRITSNAFGQALNQNILLANGNSNYSAGIVLEGNSKLVAGPYRQAAPFVDGNSGPLRNLTNRQAPVTYVAGSQSSGTITATPATMEFIHPGSRLVCQNEDGTNGETVVVKSTTSTTFTAVFASAKAANYTVHGVTPANEEEGSWTPVLGALTADGTHTYSVQQGTWSRRGNQVTLNGSITISSKDAAMSGALVIRGLPFVAESVTNGYALANIAVWDGFTLGTGYTALSGLLSPGGNTIALRESGSTKSIGITNASEVGSAVNLYFSIVYNTSSL